MSPKNPLVVTPERQMNRRSASPLSNYEDSLRRSFSRLARRMPAVSTDLDRLLKDIRVGTDKLFSATESEQQGNGLLASQLGVREQALDRALDELRDIHRSHQQHISNLRAVAANARNHAKRLQSVEVEAQDLEVAALNAALFARERSREARSFRAATKQLQLLSRNIGERALSVSRHGERIRQQMEAIGRIIDGIETISERVQDDIDRNIAISVRQTIERFRCTTENVEQLSGKALTIRRSLLQISQHTQIEDLAGQALRALDDLVAAASPMRSPVDVDKAPGPAADSSLETAAIDTLEMVTDRVREEAQAASEELSALATLLADFRDQCIELGTSFNSESDGRKCSGNVGSIDTDTLQQLTPHADELRRAHRSLWSAASNVRQEATLVARGVRSIAKHARALSPTVLTCRVQLARSEFSDDSATSLEEIETVRGDIVTNVTSLSNDNVSVVPFNELDASAGPEIAAAVSELKAAAQGAQAVVDIGTTLLCEWFTTVSAEVERSRGDVASLLEEMRLAAQTTSDANARLSVWIRNQISDGAHMSAKGEAVQDALARLSSLRAALFRLGVYSSPRAPHSEVTLF